MQQCEIRLPSECVQQNILQIIEINLSNKFALVLPKSMVVEFVLPWISLCPLVSFSNLCWHKNIWKVFKVTEIKKAMQL